MNMLILGGNGFIGSHLVDKLLAEGHNVRVLDKYEERYRLPLSKVDYCYGEFGNRGLLLNSLEKIDIVFHLVNTTLPKTSNDDPIFDVQSNVIETLFLLEHCVLKKIKKIIFISSGGTVYGIPEKLPVTEHHNTNPDCSYGITKLTIEKYLALFNKLYGLEYTIIRPSNPYGSRQNPKSIQGAIPIFLGKVAKNEVIEIWGNGEIVRDYIFISDLIDGIYLAAIQKSDWKIFNLGSGIGTSLNDVINTISEITEKKLKIEYKAKRVFDIPTIFLDVSKARTLLNWTPRITLKEGIKATWQFVQSNYKSQNDSNSQINEK